jgi:hypothetical protein
MDYFLASSLKKNHKLMLNLSWDSNYLLFYQIFEKQMDIYLNMLFNLFENHCYEIKDFP